MNTSPTFVLILLALRLHKWCHEDEEGSQRPVGEIDSLIDVKSLLGKISCLWSRKDSPELYDMKNT